MNQQSFNNLEKAISTSRLSSYKNSSNYLNGICEIPKNNKELLANYILNAKLSENFYFLLQNLEVCLRNTIYDSFNTKFSDKDFFNLVNPNTKNTSNFNKRVEFHSYSCWKMIGTVKYQLNRSKTKVTDGKIISELNFGFCTTLLEENHYTPIIWRQIFKTAFPNFPHGKKVDSDVTIISNKINKIRLFRNRIFHYEPIFNHPELLTLRNNIIEAIGWINNDMKKLSLMYDESKNIILKKSLIILISFHIKNFFYNKKPYTLYNLFIQKIS